MTTTLKRRNRPQGARDELSVRNLRSFFALTFALGWGFGIVMVVFSEQIEAIFGEISGTNPMFVLTVWSPAFAGIYLVWRHHGAEGVRRYLRRVTLWRMPGKWWLFLILGIPAVKYLGAAFNGALGDFPYSPWYDVLGALALTLIIGPIEELGWRGVALPLLQRRFAPLWASLILGGFWGLWHLPSFFLSGTPQSAWEIGPYVIGVLALSVLVTPMFNAASGSILVPALFHWQMNGPAWPEAQPWENYIFALLAIIIVVLNRKTMTKLGEGSTEVLAP